MEQTKTSLRREFRDRRSHFSQSLKEDVHLNLKMNMIRLIRDLSGESTKVCLYCPKSDEAYFDLEPKHQFFYPRIEGQQIKFYRPKLGEFIVNSLGIEEPDPTQSEDLPPGGEHLVFTPAVAVDTDGHRLGMGRGYYDRFFADNPNCIRIGLVYQVQIAKVALPTDRWDQQLDWIVTENMILKTSRRNS